MRVLLALPFLLAAPFVHALGVVEADNPHAHPKDRISQLGIIRGQPLRDFKLVVTAEAGEAWSLELTGLDGATATPSSGTGPGTLTLRLREPTASSTLSGTIGIKDISGVVQQTLPVEGRAWPERRGELTRDDVKVRTAWPDDPSYHELWDLWGFTPDEVSHPGSNIQLDTWERSACPSGSGANCTREGQAGIASGMSADRAWGLTTGDRSITLAVLDSGMKWRNRDIIEQVRLNVDELVACPPPGAIAAIPDTYDVNHDGWVNIRDYDDAVLEDWNANGHRDPQDLLQGTIDGHACSDGIDDDGNGYIDDIAGWDFFWDDNDPGDDDDFNHGEFEARLSVGQAHNGIGGIGVCPTCSFIALRVGDSFIVDVNRYAQAVLYAVDSGASVVQQALGGLNNTTAMNRAVDYAYHNGVPVIAAASDLLSYHHNWPANASHAFMVHAIVYDALSALGGSSSSWSDATTFLNFNNCTNYGAKLMLSAPGTGCSSESTAKVAGHAGLVLSRFRDLARANPADPYFQRALTTEEVYQLLIAGAEDIDVPGAEKDPEALALRKFPSNEGWDEHFGYGRNNAYRSLKLLDEKRVPPELEISSPGWFEYVRAVSGDTDDVVEIRGRAQNLRTDDQVCIRVRWARGVAPSDDDFEQHVINELCLTPGLQAIKTLGTINVSELIAPSTDGGARTRDDRTITVEISAEVDAPGGTARAVTRRAFFVEQDDQLAPGFPMYLGASGESSPRYADLNGDGRDELIIATADGVLHALDANGHDIDGFPVRISAGGACGGSVMTHPEAPAFFLGAVAADTPAGIVSTPAVAELVAGEGPSIIVPTVAGAVFVFDSKGQQRSGFPVCLDLSYLDEIRADHKQPDKRRRAEMSFLSSPLVTDLEGDGTVDIAIGGGDGRIHVWLPDGTMKRGFPVQLKHPGVLYERTHSDRVVSSPIAADIDGDGRQEIVVGSNERFDNLAQSAVYAIYADGHEHPSPDGGYPFPIIEASNGDPVWPQTVSMFTAEELLPTIGRGHPTTAVAADLDGDGKDEVITAGLGSYVSVYTEGGLHPVTPTMLFSGSDFGPGANVRDSVVVTMLASPSIGDLDGDGNLDVMNGLVGVGIAGLISQGGERVLFDHALGAWDIATGTFQEGFPRAVDDFQILMNYPIADVDGDGQTEVLAATAGWFIHAFRADGSSPPGWPKLTGGFLLATPALGDADGDGLLELAAITRNGYLFVWRLPGPTSSMQWSGFKHDRAGTGNIRTPLLTPEEDTSQPCSCLCADDNTPGVQAVLLGALALVGRKRRTRR